MMEHGFEGKPTPTLCFKSSSCNTSRVHKTIEGALKRFETALRTAVASRKTFNTTNITKLQENIKKYFQSHPECEIM